MQWNVKLLFLIKKKQYGKHYDYRTVHLRVIFVDFLHHQLLHGPESMLKT